MTLRSFKLPLSGYVIDEASVGPQDEPDETSVTSDHVRVEQVAHGLIDILQDDSRITLTKERAARLGEALIDLANSEARQLSGASEPIPPLPDFTVFCARREALAIRPLSFPVTITTIGQLANDIAAYMDEIHKRSGAK